MFVWLAFGGSLSVAFYLDWAQEQDRDYCGSITSSSHLPQQTPLNTTGNITSAEFPNSHQILPRVEAAHMYLHQKYTDMLKQGLTAELTSAVESQIITPQFRSLYNQSALAIAFLNQQYEVFVWLKSMGFREFAGEGPFEINSLSNAAKYRVKVAMYKIKLGIAAGLCCRRQYVIE